MGTLYECLREARLEQFYQAFRANGITRSESLINLGMPEFFALGITSNEDKRRLIELVNIIRSVHSSAVSSGHNALRRSAAVRQPTVSSPFSDVQIDSSINQGRGSMHIRSQRSPSSRGSISRDATGLPVQHLEPFRDIVVQERTSHFSVANYLEVLRQMSEDDHSEAAGGNHSDEELTLVQPSFRTVASPSSAVRSSTSKSSPVERIKHSKKNSYNYGVHKVNTPAKPRFSRSGSHRISGDERIKVCVRKRPLTGREKRAKDEDIVTTESTNMLIVNESKLAVDLKAYTLQHEFIFDEVFDENCSNEDVYLRAARPLISCIFSGGTATCFAYGQTGAGKTHTMLGGENVPGLYLLAGQDIFSIIQSGSHGRGLHVWVSFFEIYCGQLFDLLNKRSRLQAREDGSRQVCIAGLKETEATSVASLVKILEYGNLVRSKGASGVNPDSSRSHAILQLDIRNNQDAKIGKMSFIDLAGSERASDVTDTDKQTRIEGAEINQSLLALKECIRSIDQENKHTPFRQSKLTHILKDSFVGNSRTCMIATISPAQSACENTLNTLRYADRVKELKRESSRSSSVGQAMNLLMNIPPTAPSVFHPSNILYSSTPVKSSAVLHRERTKISESMFIDPSETPVRGHSLQRRNKEASRDGPVEVTANQMTNRDWPVEAVVGQMSRTLVIHDHHVEAASHPQFSAGEATSRSAAHATAASQGAFSPPPEASPSESEQTDTDSCNVTHPVGHLASQRALVQSTNKRMMADQAAVTRSTDTEFDFPTSDFNNLEELNDLNRSNPQPRLKGESRYESHKSSHGSSLDQATSAAAASEQTVAAPVLRPVVYRSINREEEITPTGSVPQPAQITTTTSVIQSSLVASPQLKQSLNLTRANARGADFSSDNSIEDEDLLMEGLDADGGSQRDDMALLPFSQDLKINPHYFINEDLMVPVPDDHGDSQDFHLKSNTLLTGHAPTFSSSSVSVKSFGTSTATQLENILSQMEALTHKVTSSQLRLGTSSSLMHQSRMKQLQHPGDKVASEDADTFPGLVLRDHESPLSQQTQPQRESPLSQQDQYQKQSSVSQQSQYQRQSPTMPCTHSTPTGYTYSHRSSPNKLLEDSLQGSTQCLSDGSDNGSHKASISPTGDMSGDSFEGTRASFSDQGQSGHRLYKSNMRKGRSDPMLALDTQRKKHTLPDPQCIAKMMTRSSITKAGISTREAGLKVNHNNMSPKLLADVMSHGDVSQADYAPLVPMYISAQRDAAPELQQLSEMAAASCASGHGPVTTTAGTLGTAEHRDKTKAFVTEKIYHGRQLPVPPAAPFKVDAHPASKHEQNLSISQPVTQSTQSGPGTGLRLVLKPSSAIITEKLSSGAIFSPIHPAVDTSLNQVSLSESLSSSPVVYQPTPVTANPRASHAESASETQERSQDCQNDIDMDEKIKLVTAHEDQLATITSLCKSEMRLLLNAKKVLGKKGFDDYLRRVCEILEQKMAAIASLHDQISIYRSNQGARGSPATSVMESSTSIRSMLAGGHSNRQSSSGDTSKSTV